MENLDIKQEKENFKIEDFLSAEDTERFSKLRESFQDLLEIFKNPIEFANNERVSEITREILDLHNKAKEAAKKMEQEEQES